MSWESDLEGLNESYKQNKEAFIFWVLIGIYCIWAGELYNESVFYYGLIFFLFLRARRP
jgi:hypothetical protein